MTNDHHCRIYEDGSLESLPSFWEFYSYSKPDEREERKREFYEHNQEVEKILSDKGFTLDGSEYGSLLINRYLLTNNDEDDSADR